MKRKVVIYLYGGYTEYYLHPHQDYVGLLGLLGLQTWSHGVCTLRNLW